MQFTFKSTSASYDEMNDILTATVQRVDDNQEIEIYTITAALSTYSFKIDHTPPFYTEAESDYAPAILYYFMRAFKNIYNRLDASASPVDVFDEEFEFLVDLD